MAYEHAIHSLTAENGRLLKHFHDEATGSEFLVVAWTGLERDYFEEYKSFLQSFTWPSNFESDPNTPVRLVDDPTIGSEQVVFSGAWLRSSVVAADDDSSEIILTLLRVYDSIRDSAGVYRRAILLNREQYKSSEKALVLQFRNIDPRKLKSIVDVELVADSFAGIVTGNETYPGTWYNRQAPQATDEGGAGVITWLLMKHQNDDQIFTWMRNAHEREVHFFKHHMLDAGWKEFLTDYYFTADGHVYVSKEGSPGVGSYTAKDGESATGILPGDARLLTVPVPGRLVDGLPQYREDDQTTELRLTLLFGAEIDELGVVYRLGQGAVATDIDLVSVTESRKVAFLEHTYTDLAGNWYYAEAPPVYTAKNGFAESGTLPGSSALLSENLEGQSVQLQLGYMQATDRWNVRVGVIQGQADDRVSRLGSDTCMRFRPTLDTALVIDKAQGVSRAQVLEAEGYYNSACPAGVTRRIEVRPTASGLYDYDAIEVSKSGVAVAFTVGSERVYLGFNYTLQPTTDLAVFLADSGVSVDAASPTSDLYYLVGGVYELGAWTTTIRLDSTVTPHIDRNDDGTWNWTIRHVTQESFSYGVEDPELGSSGLIFEYGSPGNETRWLGRYLMQDITGGTISLKGYYEAIPAAVGGEFGTHGELLGRRVVSRSITNERIVDGKLSYDVYDNVVTADINTNDDWFFMGATESLDREKKTLVSEQLNLTGYDWATPELTKMSSSYSILRFIRQAPGAARYGVLQVQGCTKRRKTVIRERKYFVQRPTTAILAATMDHDAVSLATAIADTANEQTAGTAPAANEAVTYDVVRLGAASFAVERMTVRVDDEFYVDTDAFDRFVDSDGATILKHSMVQVSSATIPAVS